MIDGISTEWAVTRPDSGTPDAGDSLSDLPPADTTRWVSRRKAQVVHAVNAGRLTVEDACKRYRLSQEEYESWRSLVDKHGVRGLRATRIQDYRPASRRRNASGRRAVGRSG